jgi:hypothetical protein
MNAAPGIAFVRHSGSRGIHWFKEAYAMLSMHRLRWVTLLLMYYLLLGVIDLVPYVGQLAVPLLKPVFAVGFLAAAWAQERGHAPEPRQLFEGFRSNLWALLPLGLFLLLGILLAISGSALLDGGKLVSFLTNPPAPPAEGAEAPADAPTADSVLGESRVQAGMLFAGLLGVPVVLALWFAPALVVFQDCGAGQAIATSLRAALANWQPILVYGVLVFFWGGLVPGVSATLIAMIAPKSIGFIVVLLGLLPYVCLFTATLHISDYVAYRDIFHAGESGPSPPVDSAAPQ